MRYVHPASGWFADVPAEAASLLTRRSRLAISPETEEDDHVPMRGVEMRGVVVQERDGWVVVSCAGLFVGGPCEEKRLAVGARARVLIT